MKRPSPLVILVILVVFLIAFTTLMNHRPKTTESSHFDSSFAETGSWRDPGGAGSDLRVDPSPDGSRLLLVGYGAPNELRVTDRSLKTIAVLEPPGTPFAVRGAVWSETARYIVAWGRVSGATVDAIAVYNGTTYAPAGSAVPRESVPLTAVDCARFVAGDRILALAGDDPNGTSTVVFLEVGPFAFLKSNPHPGGATVLAIESDGVDLLLLDDAGYLSVYSTRDWTPARRYHDLNGTPTAWSIEPLYPWLAGDSTGRVTAWQGHHQYAKMNLTLASRPVEAICWGGGESGALVGTPAEGGGSLIQAWGIDIGGAEPSVVVAEARTNQTVVMMASDHATKGGVLAAFDDGTLKTYWLDIKHVYPPPNTSFKWKDLLSRVVVVVVLVAIMYEVWRWREQTR
jgi:hypothetical protein